MSTSNKKSVRLKPRAYIIIAVILLAIAAGIGAHVFVKSSFQDRVVIEVGDELPDKSAYLKRDLKKAEIITDMSQIDTSKIGEYTIKLKYLLWKASCKLSVLDTTAPVATAKNQSGGKLCTFTPEDFIESCTDATQVTYTFSKYPAELVPGDLPVQISIKDEAGNETLLDAVLTIFNDTEGPKISGIKNKTVYVGDNVSYKEGVVVKDNYDNAPTLEIDNSQVDLDKAGVYTVTYKATDNSGNVTISSINIKVEKKPVGYENVEELNKKADKILAKVINDKMSDLDKIYNIYVWVRKNVKWSGHSDKTSATNEAIRAINGYPGDCFTCYSTLKVLLERAGFETIDVRRVGGATNHFWHMIKYQGQWYYIDACRSHEWTWVTFLMTDADLDNYTKTHPHYYQRNTSLYPKTPTTRPAYVTYVRSTDTYTLHKN